MDDSRPSWGRARRTAIQIPLVIMAIFSRIYVTYALIGLWNRCFGGWRSIFFCYAGSQNFVSHYAPPGTEALIRWVPSPIGFLDHNGARGLVIAAPVSESDFLDPANERAFRRLRKRIRLIARLMGVKTVNLAGILPGILRDDDILDIPDTRATIAAAVNAAGVKMTECCFDGARPPVILLGGAGYVGAPTAELMWRDGFDVHIVDTRTGKAELPAILRGRRCLLIDISRRGVIADYIPQMWEGMVVLNETFPRPSGRHTLEMSLAGVDVFHLSGLKGSIVPPLPFGYENAVPCCAAHGIDEVPKVRIVRLQSAINSLLKLRCNEAA
ncbi:MAG: hypothetical protein AAF666_06190 [Pseudomonadota bacterium]